VEMHAGRVEYYDVLGQDERPLAPRPSQPVIVALEGPGLRVRCVVPTAPISRRRCMAAGRALPSEYGGRWARGRSRASILTSRLAEREVLAGPVRKRFPGH
jgi:hypothetical protein